ncbi:hypothetical protein RI129_008382 [Pyrocoelia pectoralis]|uniref:Phenoloxidase-activating factor 2 n=1 Tax=Pyrocoelia pectoralis TaxID=417401 RepID=A0AAN7ZDN2_9COLE
MRLIFLISTLLGLISHQCTCAEDIWSWNNEDDVKTSRGLNRDEIEAVESSTANSTIVEDIVDTILSSTRQGRNLNGFDQLYSDPNVQVVLQKGDDREARNIIKDKLCSLGLMQCEGEIVEGKRPYISPEDLVYAQPVDIKPIGRPIPSIPVKHPIRGNHYGPPRPVTVPGKFGPPINPNTPPRRGYGPPQKPFYTPPHGGKPFINGPPIGSYYEESEGFLSKPPGPIFTQPIEPDNTFDYDHISSLHHSSSHQDKKPVEVVIKAPTTSSAALQQHVHHHFHHASGNTNIKVPVQSLVAGGDVLTAQDQLFKPTPGSFHTSNSIYNNYRQESSNALNKFNPLTLGGDNFSGTYGGQTIAGYGGLSSYGTKPVNENYSPQSFDSNSFGASVGVYGNSGLYKKELNLNNQIQSNYLQSTYAGNYKGAESARAENYDCVCVPYNQCPSHDIIGRKDDLYLAIDPRNLKSNIDALTEERVVTDGNGTMTVVRVPKVPQSEENRRSTDTTEKTVTKRETKDANSTQAEARQGNNDNSRVKPTFGISFGLPNQGGGGYPLNPLSPYPLVNPYGSTFGGGGINLGLVSVNPLLSIQVTKDDYGEKVVKPFVNLHVTPNNFLVHKLDNFFSLKKEVLFNKLHAHPGPIYHKPPFYGPPHIHHGPPHIYHGPPQIHHGSFDGPPTPFSHGPPESVDYDNDNYEGHQNYAPNYGGDYEGGYDDNFYGRSYQNDTRNGKSLYNHYQNQYNNGLGQYRENHQNFLSRKSATSSSPVKFPESRKRRDTTNHTEKRQAHYYGGNYGKPTACGPRHVCCKRPLRPQIPNPGFGNLQQCGARNTQGINGRIKNPVYVDGDSEFGEYPWQVAILKKDPKESVYVCGGTLIDNLHILTAAHCVKSYSPYDLRVRLGEWDVNHDVEFYPYVEGDISSVEVHPEFYAGTLYNDLAVLRMDKPVDLGKQPHISPACLPHPQEDYTGQRCWTTGWGKDAFGEFGKYQNILKEVDVPVVAFGQCQQRLQQTRLGYEFKLHPGFICAGGEEGKDACKGDGGGPMVCERGGTWRIVGVVSWGIGCGQPGVPGVYVNVAHYLDWIRQITQRF